jgi:hypothetical protein
MLSKCANPKCSAQFRHLSEGKLFHVRTGPCPPEHEGSVTIERFWLCAECAKTMTVVSAPNGGILVIAQPSIAHTQSHDCACN